MQLQELTTPRQESTTLRILKIEADGDSWLGNIKPKIRLKGIWLKRAGFEPGGHVTVTCLMTGVLELRSEDQAVNDRPEGGRP